MNKPGNVLINRRHFINLTTAGIAATTLISPSLSAFATPKTKIKGVAFDAFPIFDPRPVFALVNELYPEKGMAIVNSWRTAQFEYTWLRTTAKQYKNFWDVTEDALIFAAKKNQVDLSADSRKKLMESYHNLNAWPDVLPNLKLLKEMGVRLCFLSNMTLDMLQSGIKNAKLEGYFENILSTDRVKAFKPSPAAYQMGVDVLKLKKEEIAFAAFAGWDAVGAKWFGYPTYWANRQGSPLDELSIEPDSSGQDLSGLINFVR